MSCHCDKNGQKKLFQKIFEAYTKVFFPTKSIQQCQSDVIAKWSEIKNDDDLQVKAEILLQEWRAIDIKKATQLNFWGK
jgi:hypothetical protein